jgi:hypothetical protein
VKPIFQRLQDYLRPIFEHIGFPTDWLVSPDFWALAYTIIGAFTSAILFGIIKLVSYLLHRRKQRFLSRNLNPWFSDEEIDRATRYYIPTYYQNVSPALDEEPGRFHIASATAKLIPLFTKKVFHKTGPKNKFFLILADAGMGKTTFMINLYLKYKRQWMLLRPKYDIVLFPLGRPEVLEELDKIDDKDKANTILLLDAFDEDTKALGDYKQRMSDILNKAWRFRAVVITCRTHFFPSEKEQPYLTSQYQFGGEGGEYTFQHLYVSVFSDWDVLRYLHKRFNVLNPLNWKKLWQAWQLTRKSQNLIVRPMLLSHIRDLVKQNRNYEYSYQVYEALIDEWIDRESRKPGIREKYGSVEAFKEKIKIFSQELAVDMYNNREKRGGLFIRYDEPFFSETGMSLSGLEEDWSKAVVKESELRSRALLNRNAEEYKFAHKSILEYFIAINHVTKPIPLIILSLDANIYTNLFLIELCTESVRSWQGCFIYDTNYSPIAFVNKGYKVPDKKGYQLKSIPLSSLLYNDINKINFIEIDNASHLNLLHIIHLLQNQNRKITLLITDKPRFLNLYKLYHFFLYNRHLLGSPISFLFDATMGLNDEVDKLVKWVRSNELFFLKFKHIVDNSIYLPTLLKQYINEKSPEILALISLLDFKVKEGENEIEFFIKEIDKLKDHSINIYSLEYQVLFKSIKDDEESFFSELKAASDFILKCSSLEQALPHVKIIY